MKQVIIVALLFIWLVIPICWQEWTKKNWHGGNLYDGGVGIINIFLVIKKIISFTPIPILGMPIVLMPIYGRIRVWKL
jgi:hypothetical protein